MSINQTTITFERPNACRLYSALGLMLWLYSATNAEQSDEDNLLALEAFRSNLESEVGVKRLNTLQDDVYHALIDQ